MIGVVARKELRATLREGRVLAGACVLLVLGAIAFTSGAVRYAALSRERAAAQALVQEQWNAQGEKNPHSAAHYGLYAFRPALPLSFFDPGVVPFEGVSIWLEAHKRNFATGRPADDMTDLARFGELSIAFVLQALVPLALILIGYPAFSQEREAGTLRQVLSSGISPLQLFAGKFLGLSAAFSMLIAPLLLLCIVALVVATGTLWLREAAVLLAVYAIYSAMILALTLIVSARVASSRNALLILLGFWAITTFVLPRIAADAGRLGSPTRAAAELLRDIEADLATGLGGVSPASLVAKRREALLKLYEVQREEDLPVNFQGIVFGIQDDLGNAVYDKHFGSLERAVDAQVDVYEAMSLLSPRMAVSLLSQEVSGTSLANQRHFERGAETFRRRLMERLNQDITLNSRAGATDYQAGPDLWRQTGGYVYAPEPLAAALARSGGVLTVLMLWAVGLAALSVFTARRLQALAA